MTAEWILFAILCAFWAVYLTRPLLGTARSAQLDERRRLAEAKRGYLYALRDAETDFESGKLSEEDYVAVRARLEEKAAETIRLLDELGGGTPEQKVARELEKLRRGKKAKPRDRARAGAAKAHAGAARNQR
jgi:hypothetical protein